MRTMWLVAALFNPCHMKICYESTESDGILLQDQIGGLQVLHARTRRSMLLSGLLLLNHVLQLFDGHILYASCKAQRSGTIVTFVIIEVWIGTFIVGDSRCILEHAEGGIYMDRVGILWTVLVI
ncbi:hypothetical protein I3760_01G184300 [Carya illinoinensis]|nr:hypothetical protein I3760_01G184300 [Carya illinoinensis]